MTNNSNNSTSDEKTIKEAQAILHDLSDATGVIPDCHITGVIDGETESALRAYQRFAGIEESGELNRETYDSLVCAGKAYGMITDKSNPIYPFERKLKGRCIEKGDCSDCVVIVQLMLNALTVAFETIDVLDTDGIFGDKTFEAVCEFQKINGFPENGKIDIITWNRLARCYEKYADEEN